MGGKRFHVHGPHTHEVQHQAEHGVSLSQWVAILSAILSCLGAVISYHSASKGGEAIMLKNEAIIKTTQAADTWALYQAKKMKIHLMEIAIALAPDKQRSANFEKELVRYKNEAKPIQITAQTLDKAALDADVAANKLLEPHERLEQSMTLLQIAISLASITALTRKRWLLKLSIAVAAVATVLGVMGWMH